MQCRISTYYLLLLVGLCTIVLSGCSKRAASRIDVEGGTRLEFQVVISPNLEGKVSMETTRQHIIQVLVSRASRMGATEPMVAAKGTDQIVIEIPGVEDIKNIPPLLASSARIEFFHAKNVVSNQDQNRKYSPVFSKDANSPLVSFIRIGDKKEIKPGTLEYKEMIAGWALILSGTDIAKALAVPRGESYEPAMQFSSDGTRKMTAWSNVYFGKEESIATVLDGNVLSIATVQKDARLENSCVINGNFTPDYVKNLVELVNGGSLPGSLKLLRSSIVTPAK